MVQCRICLEDASLNDVIAPCLCDGTSKYVHHACLHTWRNTSDRAFSNCAECNFAYQIEYVFPIETYKITVPPVRDEMGRYIYTLLMVLLSSFFFRVIEKMMDYPSLTLLSFGSKNTSIEILENDEIYSGCYYFSLNNCIISILCYFVFWIFILFNVRRQILYWKLCKAPFLFRLFLSVHFIWGYWLTEGNGSIQGFEFFTVADASISTFNIWTFLSMLDEHNDIIDTMNIKRNTATVLSRTLEDV